MIIIVSILRSFGWSLQVNIFIFRTSPDCTKHKRRNLFFSYWNYQSEWKTESITKIFLHWETDFFSALPRCALTLPGLRNIAVCWVAEVCLNFSLFFSLEALQKYMEVVVVVAQLQVFQEIHKDTAFSSMKNKKGFLNCLVRKPTVIAAGSMGCKRLSLLLWEMYLAWGVRMMLLDP